MKKVLSPRQFAGSPQAGATVRSLAPAMAGEPAETGRVIRYVFSDEAVARDGHTIAAGGWDLANYSGNPVFLWAHDGTSPPIGRVFDIETVGNRLMGSVEYADAETYPFADTIYRLAKGKFLNAVSVSWLPLSWKYTTDRNRPGGIDFTRTELLEVSQVPVPSLPSALATARAAGIDTAPLYEWAERILDGGGSLIVPRERATLEKLRKESRMLKPIRPRSAPAAVARPEPEPAPVVALVVAPRGYSRDLGTATCLADVIQWLAYLQQSSAWEEEREGDDSKVPAMLASSLHDLGAILIAMTTEEVGELLADLPGPEEEPPSEAEVMTHAARILARAYGARPPQAAPVLRAGKVLSDANRDDLKAAVAHHVAGTELIRGILEKNGDNTVEEEPGATDDDADVTRSAAEKETRERKARVAQLRHVSAAGE